MSRALVERVSRLVDRNASRRGFLTSSAMGATAMAVAPATFALKPTTAYAAICSCAGSDCDCNSLCCDGCTDFCCLLTGENLCPPGTVVAGWWKADGSGMCDIDGVRHPRYLRRRRRCPVRGGHRRHGRPGCRLAVGGGPALDPRSDPRRGGRVGSSRPFVPGSSPGRRELAHRVPVLGLRVRLRCPFGLGLATVVYTALVGAMMIAIVLVDSVLVATMIGVVFGATRGFTVLLSAAVRTPDDLRALHRRIDECDARVRRAGAVASLGLGVLAAVMVGG